MRIFDANSITIGVDTFPVVKLNVIKSGDISFFEFSVDKVDIDQHTLTRWKNDKQMGTDTQITVLDRGGNTIKSDEIFNTGVFQNMYTGHDVYFITFRCTQNSCGYTTRIKI